MRFYYGVTAFAYVWYFRRTAFTPVRNRVAVHLPTHRRHTPDHLLLANLLRRHVPGWILILTRGHSVHPGRDHADNRCDCHGHRLDENPVFFRNGLHETLDAHLIEE